MKKNQENGSMLDVLGLDAEEKQDIIDFIRDVVQTVVDRHFRLTARQDVSHDQ